MAKVANWMLCCWLYDRDKSGSLSEIRVKGFPDETASASVVQIYQIVSLQIIM